MWLLRLMTILAAISIAGGVGAFFLTRNPKYLQFSWRVFRFMVIVALLVFALLILERVAVIPV